MVKEEEQIIEYGCRKGYLIWAHNEVLCERDKYKSQQKSGAEAPPGL
jgi:hypothetical protein